MTGLSAGVDLGQRARDLSSGPVAGVSPVVRRAVSVVIAALNEQHEITGAVQSAWQAGADEVIVADGGSEDETVVRAVAAGAQVVRAPVGRARQQNAGARQARGELLMFLHADSRLPRDGLARLCESLSQPSVAACAFAQRIDAPGPAFRLLEWGNALRVRLTGLAYGDQAIAVRRSDFQHLGGFDDLPLMEDVALMRKLRRTGTVKLLPLSVRVSARRWQRHGIVWQTLRNWMLVTAYFAGVHPRRLARYYGRHDRAESGAAAK